MSLADDVAAVVAAPRRCAVCRWYAAQSERDREAFDQWLIEAAEGVEGRSIDGLRKLCLDNGLTAVTQRWFLTHATEHHVAS